MPRRPAAFLAEVARAAVLASALVVPLVFAVFTERVFEPEKAGWLRTLALVVAASGAAALAIERPPGRRVRALLRQPIVLGALAVTSATTVATLA